MKAEIVWNKLLALSVCSFVLVISQPVTRLEMMRGSTSICSILISSSPGKAKYLISLRDSLWGRKVKPRITPRFASTHTSTHGYKLKQIRLLVRTQCQSSGVPLHSPRTTAATVNKTNRFLLRKALTLPRLMELILSFTLLALLSMALCRRLLKSPLSGSGGISESSFRKRLVLVGGFSFIISSSTWSKRQVSWETGHREDSKGHTLRFCLAQLLVIKLGVTIVRLTYLAYLNPKKGNWISVYLVQKNISVHYRLTSIMTLVMDLFLKDFGWQEKSNLMSLILCLMLNVNKRLFKL